MDNVNRHFKRTGGLRAGRVVVWGRANVGKSALVNSLTNDAVSVVSPRPHSTRYSSMSLLKSDDFHLVLVDTPSQHAPRHQLDKVIMRRAVSVLGEADAVLFMVDGRFPPTDEDRLAVSALSDLEAPIFLVVNKIDEIEDMRSVYVESFAELGCFRSIIQISGELQINLELLLGQVRSVIPNRLASHPRALAERSPEKQAMSEVIRERILHHVREEIPDASTVEVKRLIRTPEDVIKLVASVHVEKGTQKAILIGQNGRMIRRIGTEARKNLESNFGRRFYLDLKVEVTPGWRHKDCQLRRFGYQV